MKVADLTKEDFSLDVYDLNSDPDSKIVSIHSAPPNPEHRRQSYALAVRNSHVKVKWVWGKAHTQSWKELR